MEQQVAAGVTAASLVAGATGSVLLGSAAGAVVALCVSDGPLRARSATALAGFALAVAGAPSLAGWLELGPTTVSGLALLLSLFGVPLVLEGRALIADGTIRNLVKSFLSRKGGGS